MRTAAILPVKSFDRAKQRLGASVENQLRLALAEAMVGDVLAALAATGAIALTIVVTREPEAAAAAAACGARVIGDSAESGQSAAAALGIAAAIEDGFERILCVPGDCPALDPAELASLLDGPGEGAEVVVLPDRHGTGTNGLLLAPPGAIEPSFGPGSRERHVALARAAGVACRVEPLPCLQLDVDTGEDLAVLRAALAGSTGRAPRTRAVLGEQAGSAAAAAGRA
ncbi:MAG TPA: 2-phospho-L-lactate guanylyltransferase [Solirubrobacteraceae bacterium]|nr:2-phospho-L-lactate guanylyltransferase [Solirubrobacteraceae bacterium]